MKLNVWKQCLKLETGEIYNCYTLYFLTGERSQKIENFLWFFLRKGRKRKIESKGKKTQNENFDFFSTCFLESKYDLDALWNDFWTQPIFCF